MAPVPLERGTSGSLGRVRRRGSGVHLDTLPSCDKALIILGRVELVEIAAGPFWMGWTEGHRGERPPHLVWLDAFAVARWPVTNADYARFLEASRWPAPPWWADQRFHHRDQPAVGLSWFDAVAYCEWRSADTGEPYRLPTEAEWEKAARGGLEGARFPWGDERPAVTSFACPPRVTDTPANPFGLLALSGVCHEWCLDWHDDGYYGTSPGRNPPGPAAGTRRASRGGAWRHQDPWSPVAHRSSLPPALRYSDYGMRVVRGPIAATPLDRAAGGAGGDRDAREAP
jgi:formylglycine-generating enzyme required for sulfatase activity